MLNFRIFWYRTGIILSILNYRRTDLFLSTHHTASSDKITKASRLDRRGMEYA